MAIIRLVLPEDGNDTDRLSPSPPPYDERDNSTSSTERNSGTLPSLLSYSKWLGYQSIKAIPYSAWHVVSSLWRFTLGSPSTIYLETGNAKRTFDHLAPVANTGGQTRRVLTRELAAMADLNFADHAFSTAIRTARMTAIYAGSFVLMGGIRKGINQNALLSLDFPFCMEFGTNNSRFRIFDWLIENGYLTLPQVKVPTYSLPEIKTGVLIVDKSAHLMGSIISTIGTAAKDLFEENIMKIPEIPTAQETLEGTVKGGICLASPLATRIAVVLDRSYETLESLSDIFRANDHTESSQDNYRTALNIAKVAIPTLLIYSIFSYRQSRKNQVNNVKIGLNTLNQELEDVGTLLDKKSRELNKMHDSGYNTLVRQANSLIYNFDAGVNSPLTKDAASLKSIAQHEADSLEHNLKSIYRYCNDIAKNNLRETDFANTHSNLLSRIFDAITSIPGMMIDAAGSTIEAGPTYAWQAVKFTFQTAQILSVGFTANIALERFYISPN